MHGRLKVKTTVQQQEEKRIEREKKAKVFTGAMKMIFTNRGNNEEMETNLGLTQKVLSGNPDVYTLWNVRKEIFKVMLTEKEHIDDLLRKELDFLQNCLHVNPKSYGVWNQRRFVMKTMKRPDWEEELGLCNLFLKYDERNFHCWDYRRFVVKESNVSPEEELHFTTSKIKENFSNYSSWHNRSKLLPKVHPDLNESGKVDETELLKEFELVQNAFFTDPNDQSAWFYQRWLLGRQEASPTLLSLSAIRSTSILVASFSHPIEKNVLCSKCNVGNEELILDWKPSNNEDSKFNHVWMSKLSGCSLDGGVKINIDLKLIDSCTVSHQLILTKDAESCHKHWYTANLLKEDDLQLFSDSHTEAKTSVLEGELESCKILLEEEPDNKWTMLTIVYLMRALDGLKYTDETKELLQRLIKSDPMRKGYYEDLRSKYLIENELQKIYVEKKSIEEVDLSNKGLTCFNYAQYFTSCKKLNLQNNKLKNFDFCSMLPCIETLELTGNNFQEDDENKIIL